MHSALYLLPHLASCQFIYVFIYFYCILFVFILYVFVTLYSKSQTLSVWLSVESEYHTSLLLITETVTNLPLHTLFTLLGWPLLTICRKREGYMILYTSYLIFSIWDLVSWVELLKVMFFHHVTTPVISIHCLLILSYGSGMQLCHLFTFG